MWPFDRGGDTDDRPPKPAPQDRSKSIEVTRYEATIEYRNGDTETFECYGVGGRGSAFIEFNVEPYARTYRGEEGRYSYRRQREHYETLAREPTLDPIATDTVHLSWTEDYVWRKPRGISYGTDKEWVVNATDVELEIERGTGEDDHAE